MAKMKMLQDPFVLFEVLTTCTSCILFHLYTLNLFFSNLSEGQFHYPTTSSYRI